MPGLREVNVLIVDDHGMMTNLLRTVLHGLDIGEVSIAKDAWEGLRLFRDQLPDIVFSDLNMPMMDGLELTRRIRDPRTSPDPYVPIIMVSGHGEREYVCRARDAGVTEFLAKPVNSKDLFDKLVSVIEYPRAFVECSTYAGPCRRRRRLREPYRGPERRKVQPRLVPPTMDCAYI